MKYNISMLFLLLLSTVLIAQTSTTLKGRVLDKTTGKPLPGVNIVLNLNRGTSTNINGYYELNNIKNIDQELTVSFLTYKSVIKKIRLKYKKVNTCNFSLVESIESLGEVLISAKTKARILQEQALPVTVISLDQVQGAVSSIGELLNKTSGIKIKTAGGIGSATQISLRGLEGKRVGFFIDEIPMSENSDFIGLNDIPIDLIERIEIYKGIVPAKFGGSAIGGAVNLVLKEYPPKYVDVSYSLQSYNAHNVSVIYKENNKKTGTEFGVGGFYTYAENNYTMESPYVPGLKIKRDHDVFEAKSIGMGIKLKNWWFDKVIFEPVVVFRDKEIQGIDKNIQEASTSANAYVFSNILEKCNFLISGLDVSFNTSYAFTLYKFIDKAMKRYNFDGSTFAPVTKYGGEIGTNPNDSNNKKHLITQRTNLNYVVTENSSLNLNTVFNFVRGIPKDVLKDKAIGFNTNFESKMKKMVAGLNYEQHFFNKTLTNSFSVKYYYYNINTTVTNAYQLGDPRTVIFTKQNFGFSNAIRYRFTKDFLIKASYANDVRLPSETELLGNGFLTRASGDLEPEKNESFNVGVMYVFDNARRNRFQIEVNFFSMKLKNMIRFTKDVLQSKYTNFGQMKTLGADLDVKYDITKNIYLYANATYQDLRDTRTFSPGSTNANPTKGDRMPNMPYLYANGGFELHAENLFGGNKQGSKIYFESSFVQEYYYDFEQSIHQNRRIPKSLSHSVGIEHSFKHRSIIVGIQVNNITNQKLLSIFNRPLPGRTAGVKLRYILK